MGRTGGWCEMCTADNIHTFYGEIIRNQLPVHCQQFLQAPVNIFKNQTQYGSKEHVLF